MGVNAQDLALSYFQAATLMNSVVKQATGQDVAAQIASKDFVSVATTALRTGYVPNLLASISQIVGKTIFSINPYKGKLAALGVTEEQWGGITRKINYIDSPLVDDERLDLTNGQSVDMYEVRKPVVLETRQYGGTMYSDFVTIYSDQLDMAFRGVNEFNQFITGVIQNLMDRLELAKEAEKRTCLLNMVGTVMSGKAGVMSKINLLDLYNTETNGSYTLSTIREMPVWSDFCLFASAKMKYYLGLMEERNTLFHTALNAGVIMRHTPAARRKAIFSADFVGQVNARVKGNIYNPEYLDIPTHSEVSYWQDPQSPNKITVNAAYTKADGGDATVAYDSNGSDNEDIILGIVFDEAAMGQAMLSTRSWTTPFNGRGGYYNQGINVRNRWWNDSTENVIVFYMAEV